MSVSGVIRYQNLANAGYRGCFSRNCTTVSTGYQHIDVSAYCLSCCYGIERGDLKAAVVVFRNNKSTHEITFASFFSLSTSSCTSLTLIPACRADR